MLEKYIVGNTLALRNGYHDIKLSASKLDSALITNKNLQSLCLFAAPHLCS